MKCPLYTVFMKLPFYYRCLELTCSNPLVWLLSSVPFHMLCPSLPPHTIFPCFRCTLPLPLLRPPLSPFSTFPLPIQISYIPEVFPSKILHLWRPPPANRLEHLFRLARSSLGSSLGSRATLDALGSNAWNRLGRLNALLCSPFHTTIDAGGKRHTCARVQAQPST